MFSYESLPSNFLGLPPQLSSYEKSKVVILPVGYDSTTSYLSGTRDGPLAIIDASRFMEYYDPQLQCDITTQGIATLPPMSPQMDGPQQMIDKLENVVDKLLLDEKFIVMLGGEHTLSVAMVRAFYKVFPQMGVLQIDAHLDLRDSYDNTPYNHACAMRRIFDLCPLVQVGIRSVAEEEHQFVKKQKLQPFYAWDIKKNSDWLVQVEQMLPPQIYITVDFDGLDPSIMPAVGTPEPGGLLWEDICELIDLLSQSHQIIGCDFVELRPIPGFIAPDYLASKLVARVIGRALYG